MIRRFCFYYQNFFLALESLEFISKTPTGHFGEDLKPDVSSKFYADYDPKVRFVLQSAPMAQITLFMSFLSSNQENTAPY